MSPNSLASLMRSATSRRFSVGEQLELVLELLQTFGGEDDVLRHVTLDREVGRSGRRQAKPRSASGDVAGRWGFSERSSIARRRATAARGRSGGQRERAPGRAPAARVRRRQRGGASAAPPAARGPAPARAPGGRRTRGRTCAGSGPRGPRRGARRRGRSSSRARPGPPPARRLLVAAASSSCEQPRVAERAAGEHHGRGAGRARRPRARASASLRPPVRITGAGSACDERARPARSRGCPCAGRRPSGGGRRSRRRPPRRRAGGRARSRCCSPARSPERSLTVTGSAARRLARALDGGARHRDGALGVGQQRGAGAGLARPSAPGSPC